MMDISCFADITGKELPWYAVEQARELKLKHLRDPWCPRESGWTRSHRKISAQRIGEPVQDRLRIVVREFKSGDRPDPYAGNPPLEAPKAILFIAASHSPKFFLMHVHVSREYFHAKAQRPMLVRLPEEDKSTKDEGKLGLLKKSMYGTRDAATNVTGKYTSKNGAMNLNEVPETCLHKKKKVSGLTHGDAFVADSSQGSIANALRGRTRSNRHTTGAENEIEPTVKGSLSQAACPKLTSTAGQRKGRRECTLQLGYGRHCARETLKRELKARRHPCATSRHEGTHGRLNNASTGQRR